MGEPQPPARPSPSPAGEGRGEGQTLSAEPRLEGRLPLLLEARGLLRGLHLISPAERAARWERLGALEPEVLLGLRTLATLHEHHHLLRELELLRGDLGATLEPARIDALAHLTLRTRATSELQLELLSHVERTLPPWPTPRPRARLGPWRLVGELHRWLQQHHTQLRDFFHARLSVAPSPAERDAVFTWLVTPGAMAPRPLHRLSRAVHALHHARSDAEWLELERSLSACPHDAESAALHFRARVLLEARERGTRLPLERTLTGA